MCSCGCGCALWKLRAALGSILIVALGLTLALVGLGKWNNETVMSLRSHDRRDQRTGNVNRSHDRHDQRWRLKAPSAAITGVGDVPRTLATVSRQSMNLSRQRVSVWSVVPVFNGTGGYIAILVPFSETTWRALVAANLSCSAQDRSHQSLVKLWGGETKQPHKKFIAAHCPWPTHGHNHRCFTLSIWEHGKTIAGTLETCHDATLYAERNYKMGACIRNVWGSPGHPTSFIYLMPQWIERAVMHGVGQIIVYTLPTSDARIYDALWPYFRAGLASHVRLNYKGPANSEKVHELTANDCLYRFKYRADYMFSTVDLDEFIYFPSGPRSWVEATSALLPPWGKPVAGLGFYRFTCSYPADFRQHMYEARPRCRKKRSAGMTKYIYRTEHVHATFIHHPTSYTPGAKNVVVGTSKAFAFHYRTHKNSTDIQHVDHAAEVLELEAALASRYGEASWAAIAARLERGRDSPTTPR